MNPTTVFVIQKLKELSTDNLYVLINQLCDELNYRYLDQENSDEKK